MAISYLSQPFKSDPYVLPLDLGLFTKVGTIKQQQFDAGAKQTQDMVDQFGKLDVLKEEDRKYLNQKISGIVNSINSLGGVDFSDRNNVSQIENLGRDIYGDSSVLNAVASTASVRNLVKTYNDYKTNPKLNKMYSPVNEAWDMKFVNEWMADGQTGSSYKGPSAASPWEDYQGPLAKAMEKIKASQGVELLDNGLYWSKQTNSFVSPDQVKASARGMLTEKQREQMKKDAWYNYTVSSPAAPELLINKAAQQYNQKLMDAASMQQFYERQAAASAGDPNAFQHYTQLANQQKSQVETLKAGQATLGDNLIKKYKENPTELMYEIYSEDFVNGLASAYSYTKRDVSIIPNQAQMFKDRMAQASEFHKDEMYWKQKDYELKLEENAINMYGKVYKKIDPKTGEVSFHPLNPVAGGFSSAEANTEDVDGLKVSEGGIAQANVQLEQQKDLLHQSMLSRYLSNHPELGIKVSVAGGEGNSGIGYNFKNPKAQQAIENANGRRGFQMEDLQGVGSGPLRQQLISAGYSPEELGLLKAFYDNYKMAKEGNTGVSIDPDFANTVKQVELMDERIRANNEKVSLVRKTIYDGAGLTAEERKALEGAPSGFPEGLARRLMDKDQLLMPDELGRILQWIKTGKYPAHTGGSHALSTALQKIKNTYGNSLDAEIQKHFDKVSTRDVYEGKIFDAKQPHPGIQNFIWDTIHTGRVKVDGAESINPENITPIKAGMNPDGTWYIKASVKTGEGSSATYNPVKIPVDAKNAAALGLYTDPYDHLNYAVNLTGKSGELSVYGNKDLAVSVIIQKKNETAQNDYGSIAKIKYYVKDGKGNKIWDARLNDYKYMLIPVPGTDGRTPSESYRLVEEAVKNASRKYSQYKKLDPKINPYEHFRQTLIDALNEID